MWLAPDRREPDRLNERRAAPNASAFTSAAPSEMARAYLPDADAEPFAAGAGESVCSCTELRTRILGLSYCLVCIE